MEVLIRTLHMGGYGLYVWPSYGVAGLVILVLILSSVHSLKKARRRLEALQQARAKAHET